MTSVLHGTCACMMSAVWPRVRSCRRAACHLEMHGTVPRGEVKSCARCIMQRVALRTNAARDRVCQTLPLCTLTTDTVLWHSAVHRTLQKPGRSQLEARSAH